MTAHKTLCPYSDMDARDLKTFRTDLGMSQREFGWFAGEFTLRQVSRWETGASKVPAHLDQLRTALGFIHTSKQYKKAVAYLLKQRTPK